ncbi:MAG: efflux RND transporter periplasmic adaptor subunit [Elusimicrobiaceae bacterium]
MKKKIIPVAVLILIIAGVALYLKNRENRFYYSGTVEATEIDVPARLNSVITKYYTDLGRTVAKNQLVIQLDCRDYSLARGIAKTDFDRAERLFRDGTMPQAQYDFARYRFSDADLKQSWCRIYSPIEGTVLYKPHEEGEFVAPGTPVLTVAYTGRVYAYIYVEQPVVYKLSVGMKVPAFLPEDNMRRFRGVVTAISQKAEFTPRNVQTRSERTRLVYQVKVEFENPDGLLKPGMTLEAELP